jgi:glycosyltransferase involved in cell wall biosynthesis
MPRIALNGRFSGTRQPTGTQTAAFALFDAIVRAPREAELVIFADSRFDGLAAWRGAPGVAFVETPFQDWTRGRAQLWEQFVFPRVCRRHGCRIAHHPIGTSPVWKNGARSVVTLHDLNFLRHPEWFSWSIRAVFALTVVPGLRRADRVVAISDYVRDDLLRTLGLDPARLRRIYNGVRPLPASATAPNSDAAYLLCVGSLQPHKNLARLIAAWRLVKAEFPGLELRVVGRPQPRFARDAALPELLATPGVKVLGYLDESALADAYRGAALFCYPSLDEGFGLPLLEAMSLGTPVLTSNVSCLPEIAGGNAIFVDPLSEESLAAGIREALRMPENARTERIARAREWAARFTWETAAREYLALYEELA